jgi:hypothetical protein
VVERSWTSLAAYLGLQPLVLQRQPRHRPGCLQQRRLLQRDLVDQHYR